ncbi:uncharacterized protein LOC134816972 isoform X2 [Bolinopsis microptera]|uniref:uncharacterized protein LOC134816972 isoform X2 n=1 Tax=Bolinopsis microptera TaxID=2820187 RepID=UPI0030794784
MVNKEVDIAVEIYIEGEPLYVRNKYNQMILMHPPVGNKGHAGVTVGFLSSRFREGQVAAPPSLDPDIPPPSRFPKSKRLLVHFHGGGFVSGSHVQHEAYLRGWCRELDAVVVSINYALAPDNPFPKGLDDCIFAYAWCLENLHTLGCTGKSIVFMGDSAGGNLAIATAMRANSYGLRPPDGILAAYPVTYVKYAGSVSRLLSTLDILLPSGVLQCCLRAYSGVPVDSNNGFCEWMQTAHHPTLPQKTDNHQTISELNSKYISDICGKMPKYTIPAAAEMPSFSTPDTTPEPVGPTPQPDTTPEPVGPTPQPDTTYAITTPDSSPDPLATTSVDYTTSPENHIPSDSNISPSDDVTIELPILSSDPTLVIEETTVSKVEQFNFSSVQDDYEGVDSEDEVVELDTIRINPIVFDNTLTNSPGYNTFNSDIVVEHEVVADAEDRIIINESYDNIANSVVEGDINDIVSESHTALDADSNSCENSGLVIEAHSSYVLLDEQKEGKINESDNGHVEMETENSEQVVENKKSEQVVEDEHPEHAVEDEQAEQVAENELSEQVVENEHPEQVVENEHPEQVVENGDSEYDLVESKNAPENELDDTQEVGEETDESAEKSKLDNVECEVAEAPEIKQVKEVQENAESEVTETQENVQSEVTETLEDLQSEVTETQGDVQPEVMNDHVQEAVLDNDSQQNSLADELVSSEETNEGAAGAGAEGAAGAAGGSGAAGAAGGSGASGAEGAALALIEIAEEEIADEIGESAEDKTSLTSRNSLDFANKHDDKDLEKMLYEDNETRFKGAKLVLTPNHQESKTAPTTPATPVTPGKKLKEATVVRDYDANVYPEPAYVINPGEIATRKNATLLQKYFDDPFMSPYLADPETLAALPPIHVVSAEYDPLLDDSIAFCRKVKEAGGEVSLEIVPGMTHGFLNLVLSSKACADAGKLCLVAVSKMFDRGEEK